MIYLITDNTVLRIYLYIYNYHHITFNLKTLQYNPQTHLVPDLEKI